MQCNTLSLLSTTYYVITNVKFSSRPIQNLLYFPQRKDLCGLLCGEAILLLNYIVDCEQVIF